MLCQRAQGRFNGVARSGLAQIINNHNSNGARKTAAVCPPLSRRLHSDHYDDTPHGDNSEHILHTPRQDVGIVGGGITGLTAAFYLATGPKPPKSITIYEASGRLGGWIDTQKAEIVQDGEKQTIQLERGPRTLRSYASETWKMDDLVLYDLLDSLGLKFQTLKGGRRYVHLPDKGLTPMTSQTLVNDSDLRKLWKPAMKGWWRMKRDRTSVPAKVIEAGIYRPDLSRLSSEAYRSVFHSDMSVADFLRMLGGESPVADQLVSAVMNGIWGGDIDRLSMPSVMPRMWYNYWIRPPRGYVLSTMEELRVLAHFSDDLVVKESVKHSGTGSLVTFEGGLSTLTNALVAKLKEFPSVRFRTNTPVTSIECNKSGTSARATLTAETSSSSSSPSSSTSRKQAGSTSTSTKTIHKTHDWIVSTTTAQQLFKQIPRQAPSLAKLQSATITTVNLWYPSDVPLNADHRGIGYLMARHDSGFHDIDGLLGVFFDSDTFPRPEGEPPGTKLFVLLRGVYSEAEATAKAREVVQAHLGIPQHTKCVALSRVNRDCIPQHNVGHSAVMREVKDQLLESFGGTLSVAGPSYTCAGVVGSVRAGHDVARWRTSAARLTGLGMFGIPEKHKLALLDRAELRYAGRKVELHKPLMAHLLT